MWCPKTDYNNKKNKNSAANKLNLYESSKFNKKKCNILFFIYTQRLNRYSQILGSNVQNICMKKDESSNYQLNLSCCFLFLKVVLIVVYII